MFDIIHKKMMALTMIVYGIVVYEFRPNDSFYLWSLYYKKGQIGDFGKTINSIQFTQKK